MRIEKFRQALGLPLENSPWTEGEGMAITPEGAVANETGSVFLHQEDGTFTTPGGTALRLSPEGLAALGLQKSPGSAKRQAGKVFPPDGPAVPGKHQPEKRQTTNSGEDLRTTRRLLPPFSKIVFLKIILEKGISSL